jgi:hypothetical protein
MVRNTIAELKALTERAKRMVAEFAADTDPDWKPASREIVAVLDQIEVVAGLVNDEPDADAALASSLADEVAGMARCYERALLAKADIPYRA